MEISLISKIGLLIVLMCVVNTTYEDLLDNTPTERGKIKCHKQCACSATHMLCSGANITEVLDFGFDLQVQYLDISNTTLDQIPSIITFMSNCKRLDLSSNRVQSVEMISWQNFWQLEELSLSNNSVMDITALNLNTLFLTDKNIRMLNLSNNNIMDLGTDVNTVLYSESLQVLDVSDCRINSLVGPMVLSGLKKLKYLNLADNPLTRFDGLYSGTLNSLNIRGCLLNYLHEGSLRGFKNLEIVDASSNDQLYITNAIHSASLKSLDLSECSVRTPNLLGMPDLRFAFLNGNSIRKLMAYQFVNNTKIKTLDLSDNNVESVDPLAFYGMTSLVLLDLSKNMITEIPWETFMDTLPSMEVLKLSHNLVSQVGVLKSKTLRRLEMDFCQIQLVQNGAFAQLDRLVVLNVSNNPLQMLLPNSFNSTHLSHLDLSYCRISHLMPCEFGNSPNLTEIRLTGNRLVTVKNGTFTKCSKLQAVYLHDNPWRCDCFSADFGYMTYLVNKTAKYSAIESAATSTTTTTTTSTTTTTTTSSTTTMAMTAMMRMMARSPHCLSPDNVTGMSWHVACANGTAPYGRDNRKNFSMAVGVILILCVSGLMAIFVAVHENMKTRQAMRRRRHLDEYGSTERSGLGVGSDEYFDDYAAAAESVRKMSQLPSYDEAIMLPRPAAAVPAAAAAAAPNRTKRNSCTQTDEAAVAADVAECGGMSVGMSVGGAGGLTAADDDDDDDDDGDDDNNSEDDGGGDDGVAAASGLSVGVGPDERHRHPHPRPPHNRPPHRHHRGGHRYNRHHRNGSAGSSTGSGKVPPAYGGGGGGGAAGSPAAVRPPPPPVPPPSAQYPRLHVTQL